MYVETWLPSGIYWSTYQEIWDYIEIPNVLDDDLAQEVTV
jgi:hypothetical protein